MKKILVVFVLLMNINAAWASGNFYSNSGAVTPFYQRGVILFEDNRETLIVQDGFFLEDNSNVSELFWIIPVPTNPEMLTADIQHVDNMLYNLSFHVRPKVILIQHVVSGVCLFGLMGYFLIRFIKILHQTAKKHKPKPLRLWEHIALPAMLFFWFVMTLKPMTIISASAEREMSISHKPYCYTEIKTVFSENEKDSMISWLEDQDVFLSQSDKESIFKYANSDWSFVIASIEKTEDIYSNDYYYTYPLILRFDSPEIIYPSALASTAGTDIETNVYIFTYYKLKSPDFLEYSYYRKQPVSLEIMEEFSDKNLSSLHKFSGILSPKQMQNDIVFHPASDDEPEISTEYSW